MQRLRQSDKSKEPNTAGKAEEADRGSFTEFPIELLANVMTFLPLSDLSHLLRTNVAFYNLREKTEVVNLLRLLGSHPLEKKSLVTVKQILKNASISNLESAIDQQSKTDMYTLPEDDEKRAKKNLHFLFCIFMSCFLLGVSVGEFTYIFTRLAFEAALIGFGMGGLAAIIGAGITLRPKIKQCLLQTEKNNIAKELDDGLQLDSTTPLLAAMRSASYSQPAVISPDIEEVVVEKNEEHEFELMDEVSNTSPTVSDIDEEKHESAFMKLMSDLPEMPQDHPITKQGSSTLYAVKVETTESQEPRRKKGLEFDS